ncbi:MAG TPA: hypothetical protein VFW33_22370, partial [Gemmataceae bacterium]|nr:hypothetical protein [Gemmataceae bacterium]
ELVQFDPVPGPSTVAENKEITLPESVESTLVYSVAAGRTPAGFDPQRVLGAKRIIISKQDHSAGLAAGFMYDGKPYKGSGLNSLPRGGYVDLNDTGEKSVPLEKVASAEEAMKKFDDAFKAAKRKGDPYRRGIVEAVMKEFFNRAY